MPVPVASPSTASSTTATGPVVEPPQQRGPWVLLGVFVLLTAVFLCVPLVPLLGWIGAVVALVLAAGAGWLAWARADRAVLSLTGAQPADPARFARYHNVVEGLSSAHGLTTPTLHVVEDAAPNLLVVGRDPRSASLVATTGLLERLDRMELEAVVAHQLTYLRSNEIGVATLAVTTVGLLTLVADRGVLATTAGGGRAGHPEDAAAGSSALGKVEAGLLALSPLLARLLRFGTGADRHDVADLAAVALTRYPPALISALEKLPDGSTVVASGARSTAHLWLAAPIARTDAEGSLAARNVLFDDHAPMDLRVATLREL